MNASVVRARTWEDCRSLDPSERRRLYEARINRDDPQVMEQEARGVVAKRRILGRMAEIPRHRALVVVS